ncbi:MULTISPECIES: futalosine hydrolase [unclassified Pedobacter]|uniref:futalosine hydrolase n=1 Tax=unclassified Pedobacter TaxID=2628915 RepID=UPI001E4A8B90|nr:MULTISPECIES: futalosine hydrolase [unclassified Pedobacter]
MKLLVVAATKAELTFFYQHFSLQEGDFMEEKKFDVLITGVGMVATAFSLGKYLTASRYNLVLNLGIAGSFDRSIELGQVVNITQDTFAELGAEDGDNFLTITDLGFGESTYKSKSNIRVNLPQVAGVTVNRVSGNDINIKNLVKRLNPATESMEGAAVLFACHHEKIDCLQIRSISNYVEPRNKDKWKIGLAIKNLNDWAISFIGDMN